jgi:hypothetical protein
MPETPEKVSNDVDQELSPADRLGFFGKFLLSPAGSKNMKNLTKKIKRQITGNSLTQKSGAGNGGSGLGDRMSPKKVVNWFTKNSPKNSWPALVPEKVGTDFSNAEEMNKIPFENGGERIVKINPGGIGSMDKRCKKFSPYIGNKPKFGGENLISRANCSLRAFQANRVRREESRNPNFRNLAIKRPASKVTQVSEAAQLEKDSRPGSKYSKRSTEYLKSKKTTGMQSIKGPSRLMSPVLEGPSR